MRICGPLGKCVTSANTGGRPPPGSRCSTCVCQSTSCIAYGAVTGARRTPYSASGTDLGGPLPRLHHRGTPCRCLQGAHRARGERPRAITNGVKTRPLAIASDRMRSRAITRSQAIADRKRSQAIRAQAIASDPIASERKRSPAITSDRKRSPAIAGDHLKCGQADKPRQLRYQMMIVAV